MNDSVSGPVFDPDNRICYTPRGSRDVYWCYNLNEPYIIEYDVQTDEALCQYCGPGHADTGNHVFICHVHKPHIMSDVT